MKKLSEEALQNLKINFSIEEQSIHSHFERSQNKTIYFPDPKRLLFQCQNCGSAHLFEVPNESCSSCGDTKNLIFDKSQSDNLGIFCNRCGKGFTSWTCESCHTSNPVEGTFKNVFGKGGKSGGCFIATAVYGSPFENEVMVLKNFRDNWLMQYKVGKTFVKLYYWLSPPLANQIAKNDFLRKITKSFLIIPLLKLVNSIKNKEE